MAAEAADGYFWKTSSGNPQFDPIYWLVERRLDQAAGRPWDRIVIEDEVEGSAAEMGSAGQRSGEKTDGDDWEKGWEPVGAAAWRLNVHGELQARIVNTYRY